MELRPGTGNEWNNGRPTEDDELNVVHILNSSKFPFYRAERYHQFHNGLGHFFPPSYLTDAKAAAAAAGRIDETGCPEAPGFFF
eukprot:scaffold9.g3057.t1